MATKLTDEEVAKLDAQQRLLKETVDKQCEEQVNTLMAEILRDPGLSLDETAKLAMILTHGGFKVGLFRVTDANVAKKLTVQVVYSIDDDLDAYLRKPAAQLPVALRGFLDGGIVLDVNKATAVDTMPQTGKTKTH